METFCCFFTRIGLDLADRINPPPRGSFRATLGTPCGRSMFFRLVSPEEVGKLCRDLDPSKGPGLDSIAPAMIRHVSDQMSVPLSRLINACIQAGYFPDFWKVARVTPILKAGDPTSFEDYRPISVLPVFSKIFECIIQ